MYLVGMVISNSMATSQLSDNTCGKPPSISFGIEHILGDNVGRKRSIPESIVRPWTIHNNHHEIHGRIYHHHHHHHDNHAHTHRRVTISPTSIRDDRNRSSDVNLKSRNRNEDDIKAHTLVSPLDALFKLTKTTFDKTSKVEKNSPGSIMFSYMLYTINT